MWWKTENGHSWINRTELVAEYPLKFCKCVVRHMQVSRWECNRTEDKPEPRKVVQATFLIVYHDQGRIFSGNNNQLKNKHTNYFTFERPNLFVT